MKRVLALSALLLTGCAQLEGPTYHERDAGQIFYVAGGNIGYSRSPQMHKTRNQGDVAAYQAEIEANEKRAIELRRQAAKESANERRGLTPRQKCQIDWAMDRAVLQQKLYTATVHPSSNEYRQLRSKVVQHDLSSETYVNKCMRKY